MSRRRVKRLVIGLLLSVVLIGVALAYTGWRLSWEQPTWYAPPDVLDDRIVRLADDAEYELLQTSQQVRPEEEQWTLRLTDDEINAWLAARLPQWILHDANLQWPEEIGTPQVLFEQDGIRIAAPVRAGSATRTVVARLSPTIAGEGRIALPLTGIALGRVWVPGEPLARLVEAVREATPDFLNDARVQEAIDVLAGNATLPAEFDLTDGRRVSIKAIHLAEGSISFTAVTLSSTVSEP